MHFLSSGRKKAWRSLMCYSKSVSQKALHFFASLFNGRKHCVMTSGNRISMSLCPILMNQMESKTEIKFWIQWNNNKHWLCIYFIENKALKLQLFKKNTLKWYFLVVSLKMGYLHEFKSDWAEKIRNRKVILSSLLWLIKMAFYH